jgi:hypothetical protein
MGNDVYVCQTIGSTSGTVYYDPSKPTPVVVHELIHVRQFRDDYISTRIKGIVNGFISFFDDSFDPYTVPGNIEYEARQCQLAFEASPTTISLDSGVCTLK